MIPIDRMPLSRCALGLVVSLVCVVPGGAARSDRDRGPDPEECCDSTGTFVVRFTVKIDPANHHAVLQLTDGRIVIVRLSDGTFEVRGNRSAIIRATTGFSSSFCGFPLVSGSGTVAGIPNVTGRYKDVEVTGDDIGGLLELGIGGELPTGQPICYQFTGSRDPGVPDSGAALVNYAVAYTLQFVASGALISRPQAITIRFGPTSVLGIHMGNFVIRTDETGGLVPAGALPLAEGQQPLASVALERLNGDVFSDFAVATRNQGDGTAALNVYTQTQASSFDRTQTLTLAAEYASGNVFIAAGDLTGDGASEIVLASEPGRLDVFRNNGGAFSLYQTLNLGSPVAGMLPGLADIDGDGARDAVLISRVLDDQTLFVNTLLGDGTGSVTTGPTTQFPACLGASFVERFKYEAGDVNADGLLDLIFGGPGGTCPAPDARPIAFSLLNLPDEPGSFAAQPPFEVPAGRAAFQLTLFTPPCAGTPALVANGGVFVGTADGGFIDSGVRFTFDGASPEGVLSADVDLNGAVDLTGFYFNDDLLTIQTLSLGEFATRPVITSVSVAGKNLVVQGSGFTAGSTILVDGVAYKTKADRTSPDTLLNSKKALKKITTGTPVTVQVQAPDGRVSEGVIFQR